MATPGSSGAYWSENAAALLHRPHTSPAGLTARQARARLAQHGPNGVEDQQQRSALRLLARRFESPLVLVLAFGAALSLVLRDWVDAAIILVIVVSSALLGFVQEHRASTAVAELRRRLALTANVLREGKLETVATHALVPGDVVQLVAGNLVPPDGVVLSATDFLVSQAGLTGESFPVEKRPGTMPPEAALVGRNNCVFLGRSVRSGTASMLVVETGRDSAFGAIAARLEAAEEETECGRRETA
jgi:Mg2+-importing ATPase